jgi:hypothetical protein
MSSKYKPLLKPWTPEEDSLLLQHACTMTFEQIVHADVIPGRNKNALIGRFHRLTAMADNLDKLKLQPNDPTPKLSVTKKTEARLSATDARRRKRADDPPLPAETGAYRPLHCKSIWDLDARDCRYPFDAPKGSAVGFVFCGEPVARGSKYCKHHAFCMTKGRSPPEPWSKG